MDELIVKIDAQNMDSVGEPNGNRLYKTVDSAINLSSLIGPLGLGIGGVMKESSDEINCEYINVVFISDHADLSGGEAEEVEGRLLKLPVGVGTGV